jgi:hypothetical protein
MAELSPQAQAVHLAAIDAYWDHDSMCPADPHVIAAAVLRAAADQVVPEDVDEAKHFTTEAIRLNRMSVRQGILAIAAELEAEG